MGYQIEDELIAGYRISKICDCFDSGENDECESRICSIDVERITGGSIIQFYEDPRYEDENDFYSFITFIGTDKNILTMEELREGENRANNSRKFLIENNFIDQSEVFRIFAKGHIV